MYRSRKEDSDRSDEEDATKVKGSDEEPDMEYEPKKKRANIWTDVHMERQLNYQGSKINLGKGEQKVVRVARGPETYDQPVDQLALLPEKREIPVVTVTPVADDPFSDYVDLSAVEEFGVAPIIKSVRGKAIQHGRKRSHVDEKKTKEDASSMDVRNQPKTSNGADGSANSRQNSWMRGRGRGQYWQNRGGNRGRGGYKRNIGGDPATLVAEDYSFEALMSAEFQQGIPIQQLANEIAQALGEKEPETVINIVQCVGGEKALQLFEETREIETKGGMKTNDGARRRTPGGVYIFLFKTDMDISTEVKDKIFVESRAKARRLYKQAKKKDFQTKINEVAHLMKKEKEKDDVKPLDNIVDVVIPKTSCNEKSLETMES